MEAGRLVVCVGAPVALSASVARGSRGPAALVVAPDSGCRGRTWRYRPLGRVRWARLTGWARRR